MKYLVLVFSLFVAIGASAMEPEILPDSDPALEHIKVCPKHPRGDEVCYGKEKDSACEMPGKSGTCNMWFHLSGVWCDCY